MSTRRRRANCAQAFLLLDDGDLSGALAAAESASAVTADFGFGSEVVKESFVIGGDAALGLGDTARLTELLAVVEALPPGRSTRFLRAHALRFRARLAGVGDPAEAEQGFAGAAALFREIGMPFYLAVVQLEHAELLAASGREAECGPLLTEARELFERLARDPLARAPRRARRRRRRGRLISPRPSVRPGSSGSRGPADTR